MDSTAKVGIGVTSLGTIDSALTVSNGFHTTGGAKVDGIANIATLAVSGAGTIGAGLTVTGGLTMTSVGTTVLPTANETYDLGSSSYRWSTYIVRG